MKGPEHCFLPPPLLCIAPLYALHVHISSYVIPRSTLQLFLPLYHFIYFRGSWAIKWSSFFWATGTVCWPQKLIFARDFCIAAEAVWTLPMKLTPRGVNPPFLEDTVLVDIDEKVEMGVDFSWIWQSCLSVVSNSLWTGGCLPALQPISVKLETSSTAFSCTLSDLVETFGAVLTKCVWGDGGAGMVLKDANSF